MSHDRAIAYFSMEIALENAVPTYSGGLGVLAGDTVRSAADLRVPLVAVTLLHRRGYFFQTLGADHLQTEESVVWSADEHLQPCPDKIRVEIEGRSVSVRAWTCSVRGVTGYSVPVYFLDTRLDENDEKDRTLTDYLYGGDSEYRLKQEVVLGIGGMRMLRALGYRNLRRYHMNEGHAALLTLELLDEERGQAERVRAQCVFTTHTPVPAGHDAFPAEMAEAVLGHRLNPDLLHEGKLNMTRLGLHFSHYVNGVAKKHGEVSRAMFPDVPIDSITNGVHCGRWVSEPFAQLLDRHTPGWREDNFALRRALTTPAPEIWRAHRMAKRLLLEQVNSETNANMDLDAFTIGFARRFAPYKRADLLFHDPAELQRIAAEIGPLQVVYAGKAHPKDDKGKGILQRVVTIGKSLRPPIRFAFLENYDLALGRVVTSGVDLWLNNPQPPLEASGTSGMKAALNGVPSLSVLDGWWIEGHVEGVTGWEIDPARNDAPALYEKLRHVARLYYGQRERWIEVMRNAIGINGAYFNTQRMVQEYVLRAYR